MSARRPPRFRAGAMAAVAVLFLEAEGHAWGEIVRQRRTAGILRAVMTAVEAFAIDCDEYPGARSMEELARLLEPTYIAHLPRTDAWGNPLDYRREKECGGYGENFWIRSPGADGLLERADITAYEGGAVSGLERDLVFTTARGGSQFPEGMMEP